MGATWPSGLDQVAVKLPSPAGAAVRAPGAPGGVLSTFSVIGSAVARLPAASLTTAWSRWGPSPTAGGWGGGAGGVLSAFSVIGAAVARLPAASLTTAWSRCGPSPTAAVLSAWALGVMSAQGMGRELSQAPL